MADDGLVFAERLLSLLDATRYTATYKLASLLALIDVVAEHTEPTGSAPTEVKAKDIGRRVIELYWPQTVPYGAAAHDELRGVLSHRHRRTTFPASCRLAGRPPRHLPRGAASRTHAPRTPWPAGRTLRKT